jgi:DNA uptake protein ComE-like DNA-binding protein
VVGPSAAGQPAAGPTAAGRRPELFHFDPNTIGPDSLCLLGFSQKQAESIIKYRSKGGKFRKKSDFAKMYVVSDDKYKELEPYIVIHDRDIVHPSHVKHVLRADTLISTPRASAVSTPRAVADSSTSRREERSGQRLNQRLKPQQLLIDINVADSVSFTRLYGIGGYYARKIIEYRERLGNFYSTRQLMEIPGIDSIRFEGFARNITADPAAVKRFSLDTASKSFLIKHPYVGAYAARGILLMRAKFGVKACNIENLVKERIISPSMAEKLWFYIENF